ncbi:cell division protein FtsQ/DivIB [Paenibacillus rigui]|uniref:cell division protein FtsQ/DivIB n=1 Tax=Paenibacillus rigui TaxID=554312 RepID=UPI001FE9E372|nr:FtsQ-type POTRA domain-containing protein [Paenibacillus rigui]
MHPEDRLPVIQKPKTKTKGRSSKKLLTFLFIFFVTLLCVLFFQSSLSKITVVEVHGQELLTPEVVAQSAAVKPGDHFFSVSSKQIEEQVMGLKMVQSAEVTKHFPGVIHIEVKEYPKVAYQLGDGNQPEAILADGSIVPVSSQVNFVMDKPILTGWSGAEAMKTKLCQTLASVPESYLTDISEIKPDPTESYPDRIKMYTRSQFEVITTVGYLPEKLKYLDTYIANLKENKINTGVLKLLEADTHAPFDNDAGKNASSKDAAPKDGKTDKKTTSGTATPPPDPKKDPAKDTGKTQKPSGKETTRN